MDLKKSVTVSRSRKINLSLYDKSKGYESEDFFVSMEEEVRADSSKEEVQEVYTKLISECDLKLREVVKARIIELKTPKEVKKEIVLAKEPIKYKIKKSSNAEKAEKNRKDFIKENPDTKSGAPFN